MEDSTPILARRTKGMTEDCAVSEPTDAEMNAARKALARWQTPEEFEAKVKSFSSLVKSSTLFNKANACFLSMLFQLRNLPDTAPCNLSGWPNSMNG